MNGVAVAAMVALAFLIPLAVLVQQLAHERAVADAERLTAMVTSVLVTGDPEALEQVVTAAAEQGDELAVYGVTEQVIGTGRADPADVTLAAQQPDAAVVRVEDGLAYLQPVEVDSDRVAVVEVWIPEQAMGAGVRTAWWALAAVALGLVLGAAVVGDRLADRMVRPARALADAAGALGNGDWEVRVQPSGPRELAEAGYAFNRMAERLETLHTTEREMVADLSHRLRTPLTGLRLDVEALEAASDPFAGAADFRGAPTTAEEADRRRTAARVRQALATLEHEIDVLIRTTREAAAGPSLVEDSSLPAGLCDASEVLADRMTFWSAVAGDQDRPCEVFGTHEPAPVRVPPSELGAALDAVLGNAFRYTPQGTALEVAVSRHDGWVAVRVEDAGPGIADPDRALKRGASGRGSTGLGLDIARRVAQAGGGSVSVGSSSQLGGASVVMLFADADAPPPQPVSRRGLIGRLTREPRERWERRERRERRRREHREARARTVPRGRTWPRQQRPFE